MRLAGKVALISGGARGMGAAEARLFAAEGARVVVGDLLEDDGKQVETDINGSGGEALFVRLDVTRESDWQQAVRATVERFQAGQSDAGMATVIGEDLEKARRELDVMRKAGVYVFPR